MIRVLIIDDEPQIVSILDTIITSILACEVTKAYSCKEAYRILEEYPADIIFLDINLGDGDGYEVLRKVPEGDTKVVMMSAYFTERKDEAKQKGASLFIEKPFTKEAVVNSLKTLAYL